MNTTTQQKGSQKKSVRFGAPRAAFATHGPTECARDGSCVDHARTHYSAPDAATVPANLSPAAKKAVADATLKGLVGDDLARFVAAKCAPKRTGKAKKTHESATTFQGRSVGVVMGATTDSRTLTGIRREAYNDSLPLSLATPDWLARLYACYLSAMGTSRGEWEAVAQPITSAEVPEVLRYLARARVPMPSDPSRSLPRYNRAQVAAIADALKRGDYRRPTAIMRADDKRTMRRAYKAAGAMTDKRPRVWHKPPDKSLDPSRFNVTDAATVQAFAPKVSPNAPDASAPWAGLLHGRAMKPKVAN